MNCKDCIYFKRCVVLGVELDMNHDKEADKNCRYFKNKSNVVEVVRCKDCKYFIDQSGLCYGQDICAEEGYDCYKNDDDFCSCGERRCNKMNNRYLFRGKGKPTLDWEVEQNEQVKQPYTLQ